MNEKYYSIEEAIYLGEHKIEIRFEDGTIKVVDFNPFLSASSHPEIKDYLNENFFKGFRVEYGDLIWGDYALTFPIDQLYSGKIKIPKTNSSKEAS